MNNAERIVPGSKVKLGSGSTEEQFIVLSNYPTLLVDPAVAYVHDVAEAMSVSIPAKLPPKIARFVNTQVPFFINYLFQKKYLKSKVALYFTRHYCTGDQCRSFHRRGYCTCSRSPDRIRTTADCEIHLCLR